jgi:hypothetical protein
VAKRGNACPRWFAEKLQRKSRTIRESSLPTQRLGPTFSGTRQGALPVTPLDRARTIAGGGNAGPIRWACCAIEGKADLAP